MFELARVEFFKLRKRMMTQVLTGVFAAVILGLQMIMFAVVKTLARTAQSVNQGDTDKIKDTLAFPHSIIASFSLAQGMATILALILVGAAVGSEFSWGTVRTMAINARGRSYILGAKLLAFLEISLVWIALGVILATLLSLALTPGLDRPIQVHAISAGDVGRFILMFARTELAILPYAAIAFLLALVGRSPAAGIGGGLAAYLIEPIAVSLLGNISSLKDLLKFSIAKSVTGVMSFAGSNAGVQIGNGPQAHAADLLSPVPAALIVIAYVAIFLSVSFYLFSRRDITVGH